MKAAQQILDVKMKNEEQIYISVSENLGVYQMPNVSSLRNGAKGRDINS